jgi:uncharacterized coiled-coil DUF342 family protein
MDNQQNNTQYNVNMCNERGEIKIQSLSDSNDLIGLNYNGELILTTRERFNKQEAYIRKLTGEIENIKTIYNKLHKTFVETENQLEQERRIVSKLKMELEKTRNYAQKMEQELNKFKQNQGGRKSKLTEQDKQNIIRAISNGWSIAQVYEQFIKMGRDVSYETIRRFVAEIRGAKKPS